MNTTRFNKKQLSELGCFICSPKTVDTFYRNADLQLMCAVNRFHLAIRISDGVKNPSVSVNEISFTYRLTET